jgi:hypothetical protein
MPLQDSLPSTVSVVNIAHARDAEPFDAAACQRTKAILAAIWRVRSGGGSSGGEGAA